MGCGVTNWDTGNRDSNLGEKQRNPQVDGEGKSQDDDHANSSDCWSGSGDRDRIIQEDKMIKCLMSLNILRTDLHIRRRVHS